MYKSISKKALYDNASLSFVFEFHTELDKRRASAKLARALGKKVKWFKEIDSTFTPTFETFKVSPIYSNGYKEICLETGFLPYHEAMHMFLKVSHVIESIGHTTERCQVLTKIRLDNEALELTPISKLNKFKYLLGIEESKLFDLWPSANNEEGKVHQTHLRFIQPREVYNTIVTEGYIERMSPNEFSFPESDFFANNFSELDREQLVIKYISGKDYTKKKKEATDTINTVIEHLYETLLHNYEYSINEKKRITGIVKDYRNSILGTRSYANFKTNYPDISLYVDLKPIHFLIESNYPIIREKLFKLIVGGGMTKGIVNYDTERRAIQIKDAEITKSIIVEDIEFYQCHVEADAVRCLFEGCDIDNSKLSNCTVFSHNTIESSKVLDCKYLGESNEIKYSYVDNSTDLMINAQLSECLVNRGKFTLNSEIDAKTKIINK